MESRHVESGEGGADGADGLLLAQRVLGADADDIRRLADSLISSDGPNAALEEALRALADGEIKYRGLADLIPQQVWTADPSGGLNYVNAQVCIYFGQSAETFMGNGWLSVLHPDDVERTMDVWTRSLETGEPYEIEFRLRRAAGEYRPHHGRAFPLRDASAEIVRWFGTNTDLADERELQRLAAIVESSEDAIVSVDSESRISSWNQGAGRLFGYSAGEVLGRPVTMLIPSEARHEVIANFARVQSGQRIESFDTRRVAKSGQIIEISQTVSPIVDEMGAIVGASAISRDIGERKRMEEELAFHALHDRLTGLPNRTLLMDRLEHAIVAVGRENTGLAVLFVDLDHFKLINDSLGHSVGDDVLAAIAPRLSSLMRQGDTVARFGGDEFVILLDGVSGREEAEGLAQRMVDAFVEPFEAAGSKHFITASVGVAMGDGSSIAETLVSNADAAMYQAKDEGRSCHQSFDDSFRERILERMDLEAGLRRALDEDQLSLAYQPIVGLQNLDIRGFEVLLRWEPEPGLSVAPGHFIPIAEQSGLIVPIGERVLSEACEQAAHWHRGYEDLRIAVNVSARQLAHQGFVETLERVLARTGVDPSRICVEITESTLMVQVRAAWALNDLRALGVQVALDDFGTGYSSLGYLKRFTLDWLKIDQAFIAELGSNGDRSAIVEAILRIAHSFDLGVVGEGVETLAQAAYLRDCGCEEAQGFLFSPAVTADEATALLAASRSAEGAFPEVGSSLS